MEDDVTLLRPAAATPEPKESTSWLPPDLQEQVRGRLRLLALLMLSAFLFDPVLYFGMLGLAALTHRTPQSDVFARVG